MLSLANKLKIKTKVSSPKIIVLYSLFAVLEVAILLSIMFLVRHSANSRIVLYATYLVRFFSMILATYIVFGRHDKSEYRFLWLLLLVIEPISGSLFYLIFGEKRPKSLKKYVYPTLGFDSGSVNDFRYDFVDTQYQNVFKHLESTQSQPLLQGNEVKIFMPCDDVQQLLLDLFANAKDYILLQTFIMTSGKFLSSIIDVLEKNTLPKIYFYLDDFGCFSSISHSDLSRLKKRGVHLIRFNRISLIFHASFNYRCHKKMIIVDGKAGFIGGMNIADEYLNQKNRFGYWFDCVAMIKGPSVLKFQESFATDWYNETKKVLHLNWDALKPSNDIDSVPVQFFSSNPKSVANSPIETLLLSIILNARRTIKIISPYLSLSNNIFNALLFAKDCGIEVCVIIPGIADKGFVYTETLQVAEKLSKSGIKIKIYTKGFSHAKLIIVDDCLVNLSSINFDYRSFYLSSEAGVNIYNKDVAAQCIRSFDNLLKDCVDLQIRTKTLGSRLKSWFAHVCRSYF